MKTLVIIASSTGGPEALNALVQDLNTSATLLIIQHMPPVINNSLREYLETSSKMPCILAKNLDRLEEGKIFLAPSGQHLRLTKNFQIELFTGESVNFVCPAADVTMLSVQARGGLRLIGVVLTGMGRDGAMGIAHLKKMGATTFAQLPSTCSIDSMPKHAIETKCIDSILSIQEIRKEIQRLASL